MAELFAKFEVNRELRWPIISKLLAGSLAAHMLAVACVLFIPGVRDAFNLASLIAGTKFVDKPYDRTEIGDDVQFVELASDKFHYPEGYFAPEGQTNVLTPPPPFVPPFVDGAAGAAVVRRHDYTRGGPPAKCHRARGLRGVRAAQVFGLSGGG